MGSFNCFPWLVHIHFQGQIACRFGLWAEKFKMSPRENIYIFFSHSRAVKLVIKASVAKLKLMSVCKRVLKLLAKLSVPHLDP